MDINQIIQRLENIKWKSIDRDNMEFSATVTCWTLDAVREAIKELSNLQGFENNAKHPKT